MRKLSTYIAVAAAVAVQLPVYAHTAKADSNIVVGFFAPTTGGAALAGNEMVNSAKLAVDEINASKVIPGKTIVLRVYDTQMNPSATAQAAQRSLAVDKADVLVGGYSSTEGVTIKQLAEQNKVVYLAALPAVPEVTLGTKYSFRVAPLANEYGAVQIQVLQALGKKRPAVLHDNSAYGLGIAPTLVKEMATVGITPAGASVEYSINAPDMSTVVAAVKAQNPDSVAWIGASPSDAGLIAKTMVEQGLLVPVTAVAVATLADAFRISAGAYDKLPGVYAPKNRDSSKPAYQSFIKKYVEKFGGTESDVGAKIGDAAAQSYDALMILANVLSKNGADSSGDAVARGLTAMPPYVGASGCGSCKIDFSKSHDGVIDSMLAYKMENGLPVLASDIKKK